MLHVTLPKKLRAIVCLFEDNFKTMSTMQGAATEANSHRHTKTNRRLIYVSAEPDTPAEEDAQQSCSSPITSNSEK